MIRKITLEATKISGKFFPLQVTKIFGRFIQ